MAEILLLPLLYVAYTVYVVNGEILAKVVFPKITPVVEFIIKGRGRGGVIVKLKSVGLGKGEKILRIKTSSPVDMLKRPGG